MWQYKTRPKKVIKCELPILYKETIEKIDTKLKDKRDRVISIDNFLVEISARENLINTFDEELFNRVVYKIAVKSYTKAAIVFKNGKEISLNPEKYL